MPSFKPELLQKILDADKTQTRRPAKDGEQLITLDGLKMVLSYSGRIKYQVGRDYACTYGRGKPTARWAYSEAGQNKLLLSWDEYCNWKDHPDFDEKYPLTRIRITDIRQQDVREISREDAIAEGFFDTLGFLETWCTFYDEMALSHDFWFEKFRLAQRPDHLYNGFAYTFQLVEPVQA